MFKPLKKIETPKRKPDGFHDGWCFDCGEKKAGIAMWYARAIIHLALCPDCINARSAAGSGLREE